MVNDLPWFPVAPEIHYGDIADIPDSCGDIEKGKRIRSYGRIVEVLNGRLNKKHLHNKSILK